MRSLQRLRPERPRAFTLVEILIVSALIVVVLYAAYKVFISTGRTLDRARRSAGSQIELENLLEQLTIDAQELVFLEKTTDLVATGSSAPGEAYRFAIRSGRAEAGLTALAGQATSLRRVSYQLQAGKFGLDMKRSVVALDPSGGINSVQGTETSRVLSRGILEFKVVPLVWGPAGGGKYAIGPASGPLANVEGSGVACLCVTVKVGEAVPSPEMEKDLPYLSTRLWCRDRLLQLGWVGTL